MAFKVTVTNIISDGTNIYVSANIYDGGEKTMGPITPVFPSGTSAATIQAYLQVVANNRPTLAADVAALENSVITGS